MLFQLRSDKNDLQVTKSEIEKTLGNTISSCFNNSIKLDSKISPFKTFPASDRPIDEYNKFYNEEFSRTSTLRYKSDRGLYLSYRLGQMIKHKKPGLDLQILFHDIASIESFKYRAKTIYNCNKYPRLSPEEIAIKLRKEVLAVLVAFFDLRNEYNFEIGFFSDIPFLRYEIMDNFLILSILPMQAHGYYPPTLIYSNQSWFYEAFLANFNQLRIEGRKIRLFTQEQINEDSILKYANDSSLDTSIRELRSIYEEYHSKISA